MRSIARVGKNRSFIRGHQARIDSTRFLRNMSVTGWRYEYNGSILYPAIHFALRFKHCMEMIYFSNVATRESRCKLDGLDSACGCVHLWE